MGVDYKRTHNRYQVTRERMVGRFKRDRYTYKCSFCSKEYYRNVERGGTPIGPEKCSRRGAKSLTPGVRTVEPRPVEGVDKYEVFIACVRARHRKILAESGGYGSMDIKLASFTTFYSRLLELWETMGMEYRPDPMAIRVHEKLSGFRIENVVADSDELLLWYTTGELLELPSPKE